MSKAPYTPAGMMMRKISNAGQFHISPRSIGELGTSMLGPRPKQIGVGAAKIDGVMHATRIVAPVLHDQPTDYYRRAAPRTMGARFKTPR